MRLLPKYGYVAVLLAAFWEGEATLIDAGALCGAGYLDWRITILAGAIGGAAGDQIYFYAAHERAARLIQKSRRLKHWYPKVQKFVLRHGTFAVLLSRFAAGLRITIRSFALPSECHHVSTAAKLDQRICLGIFVVISYQARQALAMPLDSQCI